MSAVEFSPRVNVVVLRGVLHQPAQWRRLPSGDSVTMFDLKVHTDARRAETLRVSWMNAPSSAMDFDEGDELVVSGRVRTYWSGRRSETDVLATSVVRGRATRNVRKVMATSMAALQAACP
jgi:hypothetical protein